MSLDTLEACRLVHAHRADAVVVATMSAMKAMDTIAPDAARALSSVPLMGGAAGLALGIALARPGQRVIVLDGDASLLMELGVLATVAGSGVRRFHHVVLANGVQFNGNWNLPLRAQGATDFAAVALGAGYRQAWRVDSAEAWQALLPGFLAEDSGPVLAELQVRAEPPALGPGRAPPEQPDKRFERMGREARRLMQALQVPFP